MNNKVSSTLLFITAGLLYSLMYYFFTYTGSILDGSISQCFFYSFLNITIVAFLLASMMAKNTIWHSFITSKWMIFISHISYSLYIWHLVVFDAVRYVVRSYSHTLGFVSNLLILGLSVFITFILSIVSFRLIEKPFLKLKKQYFTKVSISSWVCLRRF